MNPKNFLFLTIALLLSLPALASEKAQELMIDGSEREYIIHVPENLPPGKVPLFFVLHGGLGNAEHSSQTMGMNALAEKNHFIVAYPNGTSTRLGKEHRVWNAGGCCAIAQRENVNDVKFFSEMVKDIEAKYPVDAKRIYITGESNGAMLTYRLVCELPNLFAAAIPVSGTLMIDNCKSGQNVAFYDIHGSADKNVPYNGGNGKGLAGVSFRSVPAAIKIMSDLRQCQAPLQKTLPNGDIVASYSCKAGATLRTKLVNGGEHPWVAQDAEDAWNFAKDYSR